jgi:4'-phosphopantetheinyl transferase
MTRSDRLPVDIWVWYLRTDVLGPDAVLALDHSLSRDERERCRRLKFADDRRDFTAAHALLRCALSRSAALPPEAWRFENSRLGKPFVANEAHGGLRFSLSHTRGLVACAVSHAHDVGVDVELLLPSGREQALAEHCCSADEHRWLNAGSADEYGERLVALWTLKEAYVKATGEGLTRRLDTLSFQPPRDSGIAFTCDIDGQSVRFTRTAPTSAHRLALAVCVENGTSPRLVLREVTLKRNPALQFRLKPEPAPTYSWQTIR